MTYLLKEWKEQTRGKGLWLSLCMVVVMSIFILLETRSVPMDYGFTILLLSLYEINVYLLPLIGLFISSFSIMQEKELKTMMIITTKKESYASFLWKKSIANQAIILGIILAWFFLLAAVAKLYFVVNLTHLFYFLITIAVLLIVFNQIGIFLGSICHSRMQLIGANIFVWFLFLFLIDLVFLFILPKVNYDNVHVFSIFFFLDPLHANQIFLESSLGIFSLEHMSRLMEKLVWLNPKTFLLLNVIFWVGISFGASILFKGQVEVK
jgi:ABC-type transport system involved in multi-copper enzyme maturation permease subunit